MTKYLVNDDINLELLFCTEILKLKSLHYGYWKNGEELTLKNARKAQERYTETLLSMIPKDVKYVLDVGSGIGDNARAMAKTGLKIAAISPDKVHKKYFENYNNENIKFHNVSFQNFKTKKKFDMFLLSESQTYFDPVITFKQCNKYLKEGGYLLISDIFNLTQNNGMNAVKCTSEEYVENAQGYNLKLITSVDITKEVIPTIQMAHNIYNEHFVPGMKIADNYLKANSAVNYFLLKLFFRKQWKKFSKINKYYRERLNIDYFRENMEYRRLLFRHKN